MPLYTYKAMREDGTSVTDEVLATDAEELRQDLEARGYLVTSLQEKKLGLGSARGSAKDFLIFNQEFATLIKAGLPIVQSLEILQKRTEKPGFNAALTSILHDIRSGAALSDAMASHPAYFSPLYTATVRAGEKSGALVEVITRFIAYQKKMLAIKRKLVTALAYPAFLVTALGAVLLLFFLYIIPNFTQMYGDQGGSLPFLTTLLVSFTSVLTTYAPFIFSGIIAAGFGIYFWQRTPGGKAALDGFVIRIPLVRTLVTQYILAQLTRTLSAVPVSRLSKA
jgi:type IV pilus assembly protein PilC